MVLQLDITVDGDRVMVAVPATGDRHDLANVMVGVGPRFESSGPITTSDKGKGTIVAVGERRSEIGDDLADYPTAREATIFGSDRLDAWMADAFLRFEVANAYQALYRGVSGLLGTSVLLVLTYPAWDALPAEDRAGFLRAVARNQHRTDLELNGRLVLRQTPIRRLFRRGPIVNLEA